MEVTDANVRRLQSILLTIRAKRSNITSRDFFGTWSDELANFLEQFFRRIDEDVTRFFNMVNNTNHQIINKDDLDRLIEAVNNTLDDAIHMIDSIMNTPCDNVALHEFISYVLRDLELSNDIQYYICTSGSLGSLATLQLIAHFDSVFDQMPFFDTTKSFLKSEIQLRDFFIMFIPAMILQKKEYWSAIVHELGHIVIDHFNIIKNFYPWVPRARLDSPQGQDYYHSREFACDYIANAYTGPVFFDMLIELLYTANIRLLSTHPPWDARIYFLQSILQEMNHGRKIVLDMPKNAHTTIRFLQDIIDAINSKFDDKFMYTRNDEQLAIAVSNLKKGIPYIGSPRTLLNAYSENLQDIISSIVQERNNHGLQNDALQIEREIGDVIGDSIRLTNMQRTYGLMKTSGK